MSSPDRALERVLAPELLLAALDQRIRKIAEEVADERLGQVSLTGGREWLTASQAAEILSCSAEAIRKRAKRGRLVCRYQGTRLYVSAASVLDLRPAGPRRLPR